MVQASAIAVFSAMSLGTNYALISIPNVKLMDAFVFLAAYLFGVKVGIGVAISTWGVYGFVNPYGQDDLILLSFLIVGECFYAIAALPLRRVTVPRNILRDYGELVWFGEYSILVGFTGFIATLAYDLLTNFASWLFKTNSLYAAFLIGNIFGAPFSIIHEVSNLAFFVAVVPVAIKAGLRILGTPRMIMVTA